MDGRLPAEQVVPNRIPFAFAPLVLAFALAATACGGGEKTAEELIPNLSGEGLALIEQGRDQLADPSLDTYRALYQSADGRASIVLVYVEETDEAAATRYTTLATALENPPPEFFGGEAAQAPEEPLAIGNDSRAFVTATPDDEGKRVWTDIYRSGKVVVIVQVLATGDSAEDLRRTIAEMVI